MGIGIVLYIYSFNGLMIYIFVNILVVVDNGIDQVIVYFVKDVNGCIVGGSVIVNRYLLLIDIIFVVIIVLVCLINVVDIILIVVGGYVFMVKYEIILLIMVDNGNNVLFIGLVFDIYLFKVIDVNGCLIERNYIIVFVMLIVIVGVMLNDILCNVVDGIINNGLV